MEAVRPSKYVLPEEEEENATMKKEEMNPVYIAPLAEPLLINQSIDQSSEHDQPQEEESKFQPFEHAQHERSQAQYPSLTKMPAYIALDVSGIPKDILVKKHYEIKNKFMKAMAPDQYYQDQLKGRIDTDLDRYEVAESKEIVPVQEIQVVEAKDIEIREVEVMENEEAVKKQFIVHEVQPLTDTLFQVSYKYKSSKKEIQRINKFSGDDIFMFKELLIPYKGFLPTELPKDNKQQVEALRRANCLTTLNMAIGNTEKRMSAKGELPKIDPHASFKKEATFYLEENNWDMVKALAEYKLDLQVEVEMYKQQKEDKKNAKKDNCTLF